MAIALGGCLRAPPVLYGITEDTGGHIAYVLGAMQALSLHPDVSSCEIVTRLIDDPALGSDYAASHERISDALSITRIDSGDRRYLSKTALARDLDGFIKAFLDNLRGRAVLPAVIHAHFADAAAVAMAAREEFGIPFVYTAHSLAMDKDGTGADHRARIAAEDRALASADAVIASSRDECERQIATYPSARPGSVHRIVPGVSHGLPQAADMAAARDLLAPFLRDPHKPLVLAIARPVQKKNLVALVEAFGQHDRLREKANLAIIAGLRHSLRSGEAEQQAVLGDIVEAIDRYDLHGSVAWPRRHTQAQTAGLYALARQSGGIFVNPALVEPYGLTLVEAAAHGLPVVATRHGGPNDIVAELQHGLLVDPRSVAAIGDAACLLLDDAALWEQCSRNALAGSQLMSWERYAHDFMAVIAGLKERARDDTLSVPCVGTLVLSDIDNTLTGCRDGSEALQQWLGRRNDIRFAIATGRSLHEAMRVLRSWNYAVPDILVTSVGSEIWWRREGQYEQDLDFAASISPDWQPEAVERVLADMPGISPQPNIEQRRFKRSYFAASSQTAHVVRRALASAGVPAKVVFSHGNLLDILPRRAGKSSAMVHVAERLGIPLSHVIAVGDSGNDLDMLTDCPNAVVVANHSDELALLAGLPNVYVSNGRYAAGALDGIRHHLAKVSGGPGNAGIMEGSVL